jgi:hypothetical protein
MALFIMLDLIIRHKHLLRAAAIVAMTTILWYILPLGLFVAFYLAVAVKLYLKFHNQNLFPNRLTLAIVCLLWPLLIIITSLLNI